MSGGYTGHWYRNPLAAGCDGCRYLSREFGTCDYILMEGHSRGCAGGTGCRKYQKGEARYKIDLEMRRSFAAMGGRANAARCLERWNDLDPILMPMYKRGASDNEIAQLAGVSKWTVRNWRHARDLKGHVSSLHLQNLERKRLELYHEGKTDQEIADELNVNRKSVAGWRRRRGLNANQKK